MIQEVMQQYFLKPVTRHEILRDKDRLVAEVEVDGKTYFLKGEKQTAQFVETMIVFTELMTNVGLPFIVPEKALDGERYVTHKDLLFILERKGAGEEITILRLEHIAELGRILGKEHAVSSSSDLRFGRGTSWGMFGGNETDELGNYDENERCYLDMVHSVKGSGQFEQELAAIQELYLARRAILQAEWSGLPTGAIQGDLLPYNLLFQQDKISVIFDYDIAGDEVFVNECVANAIFLAWHHDFEGKETPEERYQAYIDAYTTQRPLSDDEMEMVPHLFAIIRAFRYDRIEEGIEKIKQGEGKAFLDETIKLLQG